LREVVERAATPGAAYGAAGNLRTVREWFPTDLDDHRAGRLKSVRHEDGRLDLHDYSWTADTWTETVTRVHESAPEPVLMETVRAVSVYDRTGNLAESRTELFTAAPDAWEVIASMSHTYTVEGEESSRTDLSGRVWESFWGGVCCGKTSEKAPDGTRTVFSYDPDGRLLTRAVLDPAPVETRYSYDALGRVVSSFTTNTVSKLGTLPTATAYDALGRVVSQTDALGNATTYSYSADGLSTTLTLPAGATRTTTLDTLGRVVSVSGSASAQRFYEYGAEANGTRWTTEYKGSAEGPPPDASAPAWEKVWTDMLGRAIREERPAFGGGI
jgi:YD repeat-containing protein